MKLWHVAALLMVLGIAYVLVARPTMPKPAGNGPSTSNAILGIISGGLALGTRIYDKVAPPSATAGTYVEGETFEDYTTKIFGPGTEG